MRGNYLDSDTLYRSWTWKNLVKLQYKPITRPPQKEPLTNPYAFFPILAKFQDLDFSPLICAVWCKNSEKDITMQNEVVWRKLMSFKVLVLMTPAETHERQLFGLQCTFWILWSLWTQKNVVKCEFKPIIRPPQKEPLTNPFAFFYNFAQILGSWFFTLISAVWPKNSDKDIKMQIEAVWRKLMLFKVFVLKAPLEPH